MSGVCFHLFSCSRLKSPSISLCIFKNSLNNNSIPNIWKKGKITSILKPNKLPMNQPPTSRSPSSATHQKYSRGWFSTTFTPHPPLSYKTRFQASPLYQVNSHEPNKKHQRKLQPTKIITQNTNSRHRDQQNLQYSPTLSIN